MALNYTQIKKLDLETAKDLKEATGPVDDCICHILAPPDKGRGIGGSMRESFKKVMRSVGGSVRKRQMAGGGGQGGASITIPVTDTKGGKAVAGGIYSVKEPLKRSRNCNRCGCNNEKIVMKHQYANIRITSPDVTSICPCPNSCIDAEGLNQIKVTVERVEVPQYFDTTESDASETFNSEPAMEERDLNEVIVIGDEKQSLSSTNQGDELRKISENEKTIIAASLNK